MLKNNLLHYSNPKNKTLPSKVFSIMKVKNGELKVKRYCSECQKWYEVTIDVDECPKCGEVLLMDTQEEQLEDNQRR